MCNILTYIFIKINNKNNNMEQFSREDKKSFVVNILEKYNLDYKLDPFILLETENMWAPFWTSPNYKINKEPAYPSLFLPKFITAIEFFSEADYGIFSSESTSLVIKLRELYTKNELHFIDIPPEYEDPLSMGLYPKKSRYTPIKKNQYRDYIFNSIIQFFDKKRMELKKFTGIDSSV